MQVRVPSFWREVLDSYLSYMVVGMVALPFAILFSVVEGRGHVSPASLSVLAAVAVLCAWIVLRFAVPKPEPVGDARIISFQGVSGGVPMMPVGATMVASVLIICLAQDGVKLNGMRVGTEPTESVDQFFFLIQAAS